MDQQLLEDTWKVMNEHRLELVDNTSTEFTCILCEKILINASIAPCGCRFCLDCIKEYLRHGNRKCPGQTQLCDFEEIDFDTDIQTNQLINRKVSKLSVKCPNFECLSHVELSAIVDHLRVCDNQPDKCPYLILGCDAEKLMSNQLRDHLSVEIHPHSNLLMNWIRQSQNEMKVLRRDIDKLKKTNTELKEKVRSDGEETKELIADLQKRDAVNCSAIELLNDEMCGLKNSNRMVQDELNALRDTQEQQMLQIENQNREILQLKSANQNLNQEISTLKERCQLVESKWDEIRQQQEMSNRKLNEILQMSSVESMETKKSIETMQIIINQIDYGDFMWEIDNFSQKVTKALNGENQKIFSYSFFTHKNGYKICLDAFFGKNYFAIYFYIMSGPFDDTLRWPFHRDVEFSLINPKTGLAYKSDTRKLIDYKADHPSLQRPKGEKNGWAFCFDMTTEEILHNPKVYRKDKIWIKFCSKPGDNPK